MLSILNANVQIIIAADEFIDHIGPQGVSKEHYPEGWEYGHHLEDYKMLATPLTPQFFHNPHPEQFGLFHRISFKIADDKFLPMSFVVHSGAPESLYLSDKYIIQHVAAPHFFRSFIPQSILSPAKTQAHRNRFSDAFPKWSGCGADRHAAQPATIQLHRKGPHFGI